MFDVKKHLIKVQGGRQYLPVAARLIWFRAEHPDWGIETKAISIDVERQFAIFESTVYNAEGKLMAKGTKMENVKGFGDWLEKSETGAIGRALAVCGYGTQFAPDLDESPDGATVEVSPPDSYIEERGRYDGNPSRGSTTAGSYNQRQNPAPGQDFTDGLALVDSVSTDAATRQPLAKPLINDNVHAAKDDACESCSAALKPSQLSLSLRKFGSALCPDCQRKRKTEAAA